MNNILTDQFSSFDPVFLEIKNKTGERELNFSKENYQAFYNIYISNFKFDFLQWYYNIGTLIPDLLLYSLFDFSDVLIYNNLINFWTDAFQKLISLG